MPTTVDDVLEFWFRHPPTTEADVMADERRWFRSGAEMDDDVRRRFGAAVDAAVRGELDDLVERLFLSMPLLHSERPELHARLASIARDIVADAPPIHRKLCAMYDEQVRKYADVIRRFGRFPHRNAILGRPSTPEEMALLRDWERRAPPSAT
jgi:uncharacterized protein (DUF924 family)